MSLELFIRPIQREDSPDVAKLIRTVMPEFGASGPGFAIHDPEVDDMFGTYSLPRSAYFVVTEGFSIFGGAGIAPLYGGDPDICELRKMYSLKAIRGLGFGQQLMDLCLMSAREHGFKQCYLETLKTMDQAQTLYRKNGFALIKTSMGATGHFGCDAWYIKQLS